MLNRMLTYKTQGDARAVTDPLAATNDHGPTPSQLDGHKLMAKLTSADPPCLPIARPTARYFTGGRIHGYLMCAWLTNGCHLLIVLFLCAWVLLKGHPAAANSTYRCEKDFWSNVFLTFALSFMLDVLALDPFFIAAIYTIYAAYYRRQHDSVHRKPPHVTDVSGCKRRRSKKAASQNSTPSSRVLEVQPPRANALVTTRLSFGPLTSKFSPGKRLATFSAKVSTSPSKRFSTHIAKLGDADTAPRVGRPSTPDHGHSQWPSQRPATVTFASQV